MNVVFNSWELKVRNYARNDNQIPIKGSDLPPVGAQWSHKKLSVIRNDFGCIQSAIVREICARNFKKTGVI